MIRSMTAVPATGGVPEAPMMLVSIRLPVALVEQLDRIAGESVTRRSDVIRDALTGYVAARTAPVGQHEAEQALDVLRRIVTAHTGEGHADAARPHRRETGGQYDRRTSGWAYGHVAVADVGKRIAGGLA
ncbi:ribbon-helix-helix domain-containing protein [Solwaraspora sp. WMMD791]|uniref:ribbon-helix-helix domain-containing protein n=1 Tax=Solwaraspora sp. WMMD791 TaxID=3016086 RepID=UPI00249C8204|nr:ribbon-helix-helix domain-containing protein [Solwaraspora sp. WMMD791]WFE26092.1 ribbon-helix-helix domain-containing protein [Solwaraspora sp. WMMD791]